MLLIGNNLESFLTLYINALTVVMLFSLYFLPFLLKHGKGVLNENVFFISKKLGVYFYAVGVFCGLAVIYWYGSSLVRISFLIHNLRRLLETRFLFKSATKMNLLHLVVGITFYPVVWGSLIVPASVDTILKTLAIILFWVAFYFQFAIHLSMSRNKDKSHLPKYWMFRYFACPNFTMEILLYLSLHIILWTPTLLSILIFVFLNQTISALDRLQYYKTKPNPPKYALLPYL
jgi:hypothetical protein